MPENAKPLLSPFFADGYTRLAVLPSELTGFMPVRISYRPITADEYAQFGAWAKLNPDKPTTDYYAPLLARKVIDWTLTDDKGAKLEVTEANVRKLAPQFYAKLLDGVSGYLELPAPDPQPTIPTAEDSLKNS